MKDELTSSMHSEFSVDPEVEIEHRCWAAERQMSDAENDQDRAGILASYSITAEQFERYKRTWADDERSARS